MTKPDMPLAAYLSDMQSKAMHLAALLNTINRLDGEGISIPGRLSISQMAENLAEELNQGLDAVNLPEGTL